MRAAIELAETAEVCGPGAAWWRSLDEASRAYGRACMGNAKAVVDEVRDVDFDTWSEVPGCRSCDELVLAAVSRLRAVVECLEAKE